MKTKNHENWKTFGKSLGQASNAWSSHSSALT